MENDKAEKQEIILAICYDFDKTLSYDNMQSQGYIQKEYDGDVASFWNNSNKMAKANKMDSNLAYMYVMFQNAFKHGILTKEKLEKYGSKIKFFPGVKEWFDRINVYGAKHKVLIEHYIISSGLKEMIEGTSIAKSNVFKEIYASSFFYDKNGAAIWPAQVVNFTNKTQYLFRIEKGVTDVNDSRVNDYFKNEEKRVLFKNMIYIGDSDTDIPCMKIVSSKGGHSVVVYCNDEISRKKAYDLLYTKRVKYVAPADYTAGSKLDSIVKAIIDHVAANKEFEVKCNSFK